MFEAEADGLRWLAEADAIRIPTVRAVGASFLCLEYIAPGQAAADHDETLGRGLAALHRAGAPTFGLQRDNFVGAVEQHAATRERWPEFYAQCRLEPLVERAALDAALRRRFDALFARIDDLCGPAEPPARLHGDLWGGNAIVGPQGEPVLIDPAVYGGHREIDLAMMRLFGGFSPRVFAAYHEAFPFAPGADERVSLYQLYPLLVHVILFGGAYVGQLDHTLRRYA